MKSTAVVYKSKYGYTEKYARWLAEALACDLFEIKIAKPEHIAYYDTIIYGGGLYAGGVNGISFLTKNFEVFREKNIILFTCGLADTSDNENIENIKKGLKKALTPEMEERIKVFFLRGGIDYSKLGFVDKTLMGMLSKMLLRKDYYELKEEEKEMLRTYGKSVDFCSRESIAPIISYVQGLKGII